MTCSLCLTSTPALQTIGVDGHCPRCRTDYRAWLHRRGPVSGYDVTVNSRDYNANTRKLISTGAAHTDKLVAARLALRSNA